MKKRDWTKISRDPLNAEVRRFISASITAKLAGTVTDSDEFLREFVLRKKVLDIGVVEHDAGHMSSPDWKHAKVVRWSTSVLGVDVLEPEVDRLRAQGYNVRAVDATGQTFLGRRYERIVIGDVVEHVNDPVALLRFARRHLTLGGKILVTTPNPFWILFLLESLFDGTYIANADHIRWVGPTMALELARRSGLVLSEYWLLQPTGRSQPVKALLNRVRRMLIPNSELFTHSYYFVFSRSWQGAH